jgi:hypothetical protein
MTAGLAGKGERMKNISLVAFMNDLVAADRIAISQLVDYRVLCTSALADHPTVQVRDTAQGPLVGMLGILCGWHEATTGLRLMAVIEDGIVTGFTEEAP